MNLEQLNVQQLSLKEEREVDGGFPWIPVIALVVAVLNTDWDEAATDFKRGYNS